VVGASFPLDGCVTPITVKGEDFRVNALAKLQQWPIGFGPSREVVVWEHSDEVWDGEVEDSPYLLGVLPPELVVDWEMDDIEDVDLSLTILEALKSTSIGELRLRVQRPKVEGRC
jgi:hypothetical protein